MIANVTLDRRSFGLGVFRDGIKGTAEFGTIVESWYDEYESRVFGELEA